MSEFQLKVKWTVVVTEYDKIYFNYIDLGNQTMFRMCLFKTFTPRLGLFVAIEDRGSFFFGMHEPLHKDYVAQKLFLQGDSGQVADFLNAQLHKEHEQQGHYYYEVIKSIEPYGKMGEQFVMPWHPELVDEE